MLVYSLRAVCVACVCSLAGLASAFAAPSEWRDEAGKTFKGEPADVLGPFAVFRVGQSNRTVPWGRFTPEECARFYQEIAAREGAQQGGRGAIFTELEGKVFDMRSGKPVPVDLKSRPEPGVIVLVSLSNKDGAASQLTSAFRLNYQRIQQVFPGQMEAVFVGQRMEYDRQLELARSRRMPWLVADPKQQGKLKTLLRNMPAEASVIVAMTRNGVPLLWASGQDEEQMRAFMDSLGRFMRLLERDNPRNWQDRRHYLAATRPLAYATGRADPEMLGHPVVAEGLRRHGIARIEATFEVTADGGITKVDVARTGGVTDATAAGLGEAMRRSAKFLPAIDQGAAVAGKYAYIYDVPPEDKNRSAVAAWINADPSREIPIKSWLVLKTFKVEQQAQLEIDRVENGVSVLKTVKADKKRTGPADMRSQISVFEYDWFSDKELAELRPTAGAKQRVHDVDYTWKTYPTTNRSVELQTGMGKEEYCYAYAWAEIDVPQETQAILALGSDDGVKVWLNGETLVEKWVKRPLLIDEDVMPLKLKAGKNQLLVKVQNIYGEWRFSFRVIAVGK